MCGGLLLICSVALTSSYNFRPLILASNLSWQNFKWAHQLLQYRKIGLIILMAIIIIIRWTRCPAQGLSVTARTWVAWATLSPNQVLHIWQFNIGHYCEDSNVFILSADQIGKCKRKRLEMHDWKQISGVKTDKFFVVVINGIVKYGTSKVENWPNIHCYVSSELMGAWHVISITFSKIMYVTTCFCNWMPL